MNRDMKAREKISIGITQVRRLRYQAKNLDLQAGKALSRRPLEAQY